MSSSSAAPGREDGNGAAAAADAAGGRPPMREALVAAAFRLFLERGYEQTTIDDIVALAGVGRRSFFRYFPSKEDVVFPDHERCLADMTAFLAASPEDADPVARVCDAARLVAACTRNPDLGGSVTGSPKVPAAAYELAWCALRARPRRVSARAPGGRRRDVERLIRAGCRAHNNALRSWLRSHGRKDAGAAVDHALRYAQSAFGGAPAPPPADEQGDVVVVVARRGAPLWQVCGSSGVSPTTDPPAPRPALESEWYRVHLRCTHAIAGAVQFTVTRAPACPGDRARGSGSSAGS
ncbi:TetR family transcriptional regulator [Streptomyces sp. DHE17-7]|nr:TetR family transcriptional regulator [Streptomyces sp. DHE17-7]MBJ6622971.1 TetR family transcriptional regulator [Streptomyces sp. DHE17-7]